MYSRLHGVETVPAHSLALGLTERERPLTLTVPATVPTRTNTIVVGKTLGSSANGNTWNTAYNDISNGTESRRQQIQTQIQQQLNLSSTVPPGLPTYARPTTVGLNGFNGTSGNGNGDALIQKVNSIPADTEESKIVRHHHMSTHVNKYNIAAQKLKTLPTGRAPTPENGHILDTTNKHVVSDTSVDQRGRPGVIAPHPRMRLNSPLGERRESVEPATQPSTPMDAELRTGTPFTAPVNPPHPAPAKGAGILAWHQYFIECNNMKDSPAGGVAVDREGNVLPQSEATKGMGSPLIGPSSGPSRPTAVLDLDETLIYAREGPIVTRPGAVQLLQTLAKAGFEIVVWTAAMRDHALAVLRIIDPTASLVEHCIYRTEKWWNEWVAQHGSISKNLRLLGRPLEKTILLENTSDCVKDNPRQSILVGDFEGNMKDDTLMTVGKILAEFAESRAASNGGELSNEALLMGSNATKEDIGTFLQNKQEIVLREVPASNGALVLFTLKKDSHLGREAGSEYYHGRLNRDSPLQLREASPGRIWKGQQYADQYQDEIPTGGSYSSTNTSYYQSSYGYAGQSQRAGGLINYDQHYGSSNTVGSNRMLLVGNAGLNSTKKESTALTTKIGNIGRDGVSMATLSALYSR